MVPGTRYRQICHALLSRRLNPMCRGAVLIYFFRCFSSFSFSCLLMISFRNFAVSPSLFFVMISCRVFSLNSLFIFVSLFTFKQVQSVFFNITCFTFYVFIVGFYNYHSGQHHKYCSCFIKMEIFQIFVVIVMYHIFLYFLYLFLFLLTALYHRSYLFQF